MPGRASADLVIDTSVARASGGMNATYPTSKNCRDFLESVLVICHCAVMTPDLYAEWKIHESNFATKWRVQMLGRKKILILPLSPDQELRQKLAACATNETVLASILKDTHLLEAAMASGKAIISLDETARNLFGDCAVQLRQLRDIVWVNPDAKDESPIEWLERGALREKRRSLGSPGRSARG